MKKTLISLLAALSVAAVAVGTLAGCGGSQPVVEDNTVTSSAVESEPEDTVEVSSAPVVQAPAMSIVGTWKISGFRSSTGQSLSTEAYSEATGISTEVLYNTFVFNQNGTGTFSSVIETKDGQSVSVSDDLTYTVSGTTVTYVRIVDDMLGNTATSEPMTLTILDDETLALQQANGYTMILAMTTNDGTVPAISDDDNDTDNDPDDTEDTDNTTGIGVTPNTTTGTTSGTTGSTTISGNNGGTTTGEAGATGGINNYNTEADDTDDSNALIDDETGYSDDDE